MSSTEDSLDTKIRYNIETYLDDWRIEGEIPGASIAVLDWSDVLYAAGQGASDVDARTPGTPDIRYPFASVSRLVTAVVVLQLVERGDLGLEDEFREYVEFWGASLATP